MATFPKSARHPDLRDIIERWGIAASSIDPKEDSQLSEIQEITVASKGIWEQATEIDYVEPCRAIVGANAIRAMSKAYEALDAFHRCETEGLSISATLISYNASFFAARSFCFFMGFAPLNRESSYTIDIFHESTPKRKRIALEDILLLHRYERWNHNEVWALSNRLINTLKGFDGIEEARDSLRKLKVESSSKLRNRISYDDSSAFLGQDKNYIDIPEAIACRSMQKWPAELLRQYYTAQALLLICNHVVMNANLKEHLFNFVSENRMQRVK